ncbi:hypothetical protein GWO43_19645 [candidate division KSB1 bacterium]|nr:hypothetical protein [candidate division KSB1 bacterium]NIR71392.1 hypothetical protein [candidate division KSB1 bacterium]NIS26286.1 hypothetical protein [candidate division KSB1 bacterium]NIT73048.1 hypothetical protein [candidate division KSB1 bacterium]NIU26956.1 hypothetical protein [candidate division KSB1 bacterium]
MNTVEFVCPKCEKDNLAELSSESEQTIICEHCSHSISARLSTSMQQGGKVDRCVICDKIRFYVQKDFNPRLGLLIFALGVIFSYHTYFLSLIIATLIDVILYKVLKTVTICYNCRAVYRGFEEDPTHRGFDHNLAMSLVEKEEKEKRPETVTAKT